jgi:hypothetical protein
MTIYHEIEPIYILGSFKLKPLDKGWVITEDGQITLSKSSNKNTHSLNPDGTMWLTCGIGYEKSQNDKTPFIVLTWVALLKYPKSRSGTTHENNVKDLTTRGVKRLRVSAEL